MASRAQPAERAGRVTSAQSGVRSPLDRRRSAHVAPAVATEFFRTPRVWEIVREHLAALTNDPVIWSGACATGQEAYSAAIVVAESGIDARIVATDISDACLEYARAGRYPTETIAQDLLAGRLQMWEIETYFEVQDDDTFLVAAHLRNSVDFRHAELGADTPPACDVALVRNVWRHLEPTAQRRLVDDIYAALRPGGMLVLGGADFHSELAWTETGDLVEKLPPGLAERFVESDLHELIWVPL